MNPSGRLRELKFLSRSLLLLLERRDATWRARPSSSTYLFVMIYLGRILDTVLLVRALEASTGTEPL
jgi:hypothetical protein